MKILLKNFTCTVCSKVLLAKPTWGLYPGALLRIPALLYGDDRKPASEPASEPPPEPDPEDDEDDELELELELDLEPEPEPAPAPEPDPLPPNPRPIPAPSPTPIPPRSKPKSFLATRLSDPKAKVKTSKVTRPSDFTPAIAKGPRSERLRGPPKDPYAADFVGKQWTRTHDKASSTKKNAGGITITLGSLQAMDNPNLEQHRNYGLHEKEKEKEKEMEMEARENHNITEHVFDEAKGSCRKSNIRSLIMMLCTVDYFEMAKRCHFQEVYALFEEMRGVGSEPDAKTYNSILKSLLESGETMEACSLLEDMLEKGIVLDIGTFEIEEKLKWAIGWVGRMTVGGGGVGVKLTFMTLELKHKAYYILGSNDSSGSYQVQEEREAANTYLKWLKAVDRSPVETSSSSPAKDVNQWSTRRRCRSSRTSQLMMYGPHN
ncbi:hypothetical protein RJ639_040815 [Escallonia herrerae]|uniref:Pentatricopeptide repeat-containing protein n=1 Tax=Escallonia herrerae TaxID=1293975 RepID=A0AA88WKM6_9ASTE|nr:hypothetical protein RJ639_040815 [Escallonia herrerae]